MTEQTQQVALPFNVLDHISMAQFDSLAKRFGYVSRAEVDAAWSDAAQKLVAETTAKHAGDQPKTSPAAEPVTEMLATKRKPGRPAKPPAAETPSVQEAAPPEGEVLPPEKPVSKPVAALPEGGDPVPDLGAAPTVTDARAALTALVAASGMGAGMKLLADFGVKKVRDVPADKIAEFITKAKA